MEVKQDQQLADVGDGVGNVWNQEGAGVGEGQWQWSFTIQQYDAMVE